MTFISVEDLVAELNGPNPVVLLDVRREQARNGAGLDMPGAIWRNPAPSGATLRTGSTGKTGLRKRRAWWCTACTATKSARALPPR